MKKSIKKILFLYFLILVNYLVGIGQERSKTIQVTRVIHPPRIDGKMDDECWTAFQPVSGFFQYDPRNGVRASEETLVWATYDQNNLYFAFLMKESLRRWDSS